MPFAFNSSEVLFFKNKTQKNLELFSKTKTQNQDTHQLIVNWHDTIIRFAFYNKLFFEKCQSYFPKNWILATDTQPELDITIYDDHQFFETNDFWEDTNSDCHLLIDDQKTICVQRDFIAEKRSQHIKALCKNELSDGFFNLMRWALPSTWIKSNKFLFHSSCVLDANNEAHLCLGPSGAGKSTISSFRDKQYIIGDDMNLLCIDGYQAYISPSLLGQRYENNELYGQNFPLKNIYWLVQSLENGIHHEQDANSLLYISQSLVNIFWNHLSASEMVRVQSLIRFLSSKYNIEHLHFNLQGDIWDYVFTK